MDLAFVIVPVHCDAAVFFAFPVHCNRVKFLQNIDEMICMFLSNIFDAKLIHDWREANWSGLMLPEARCFGALEVSMGCESFFR